MIYNQHCAVAFWSLSELLYPRFTRLRLLLKFHETLISGEDSWRAVLACWSDADLGENLGQILFQSINCFQTSCALFKSNIICAVISICWRISFWNNGRCVEMRDWHTHSVQDLQKWQFPLKGWIEVFRVSQNYFIKMRRSGLSCFCHFFFRCTVKWNEMKQTKKLIQ